MATWGDFPPVTLDPSSDLPIYLQLARALEHLIASGTIKPDARLPSENDLYELLGISRSTIRKALEDLEMKGLLHRRQGQGTFVSHRRPGTANVEIHRPPQSTQGQSGGRGIIALLLPTMLNEIYPQIVNGVEEVADAMGYTVFIGNTYADRDRELALMRQMIESGAEGIILEPTHARFDQPGTPTYEFLRSLSLPLVLVGNDIPGLSASEVLIEDFKGGYLATRYLTQKGHRHIAYLYKDSVIPAIDRMNGYLSALQDAGVDPDMDLVMAYAEEEERRDPGYLYTQKLLASGKAPTAIFYFNDDLAINGMRAIRDAGLRVPEDISVIGFDNTVSAGLPHNSLTTLEHPKFLCGRWAADMLFDHIRRGPASIRRRMLIYPELVERTSVCPPRK